MERAAPLGEAAYKADYECSTAFMGVASVVKCASREHRLHRGERRRFRSASPRTPYGSGDG